MNNSKIEWTDHTFNPWIGCTKVSPGCTHCYAETRDRRHLIEKVDHWGKGAPRLRTGAANWRQPILWNNNPHFECLYCGWRTFIGARALHVPCCYRCHKLMRSTRGRVFCASLADIFDDEVPIEWLADFLALVHQCQNLDFQLLTKRPENWIHRIGLASNLTQRKWLFDWAHGDYIPPNVWIGTSVEDQKRADERIPLLLQIPAAVRFLSCEPLLGPVDLNHVRERLGEQSFQITSAIDHSGYNQHGEIDWVIAGGESGPNARMCDVEWIRDLIAQCKTAGVPVFLKQLGATNGQVFGPRGAGYGLPFAIKHRKGGDMSEWPEDLRVRQFPNIRENSRGFAVQS